MVAVFFIPIIAIRLLVAAVVLAATHLILGVSVSIRGCLVQAVAPTTVGTRLVVAVRIIALLFVVVVWRLVCALV